MARTQKTTKVRDNNNLTAVCIVGELVDVFEGKERNYLTIKVNRDDINPKTKKPYYDNIKVTADASLELFDDGTIVEIDGVLRQYFDTQLSRSTMYVVANSIKAVSND